MKKDKTFRPDRVLSYFKAEWLPLAFVTLSGLVYNIGLLEGKSKDTFAPTRRSAVPSSLRWRLVSRTSNTPAAGFSLM